MNSVDLIRLLMCNFQEPDAGKWEVYYVKQIQQIHPEWSIRELSEFLKVGRKDYKNFMLFLHIKKQKFGSRILITPDEDIEVIEKQNLNEFGTFAGEYNPIVLIENL